MNNSDSLKIFLNIKLYAFSEPKHFKKLVVSKKYDLDGIDNIFLLNDKNISKVTDYIFNQTILYNKKRSLNDYNVFKNIYKLNNLEKYIVNKNTIDYILAEYINSHAIIATEKKLKNENFQIDEDTIEYYSKKSNTYSFSDFIPFLIKADLVEDGYDILNNSTYGMSSNYDYTLPYVPNHRDSAVGYFINLLKEKWPNDRQIFEMIPNFTEKEIYIDFGHWRMYLVNEIPKALYEFKPYGNWVFKWVKNNV